MKRVAGWEFQRLDGATVGQPWLSPIGVGGSPLSFRNGAIVRLPGGGRLLAHRYRYAKSRARRVEESRKADPAVVAALEGVAEYAARNYSVLDSIWQLIAQDAALHRDRVQLRLELADELRSLRDQLPNRVVPEWVRGRRRRRGFELGWRYAMGEAIDVVKAADR